MSCDRTVFERGIHGAPAEALRQALEALAGLSFWIAWTADPDLHPEIPVSARCMRDAATALRKAARLLDDAADRGRPAARDRGPGTRPPPFPGGRPRGPLPPARDRRACAGGAPRRGRDEPRPGGRGRAAEPACRASSLIDGDFHEPHRFPSRAAHPGDPALPARTCARERAQDPARRLRPGPAPGLHQVTRPAGEPRRPRRRHGHGRHRMLRRGRRRPPPRGAEGARRRRHVPRRPSGALQDRGERQRR